MARRRRMGSPGRAGADAAALEAQRRPTLQRANARPGKTPAADRRPGRPGTSLWKAGPTGSTRHRAPPRWRSSAHSPISGRARILAKNKIIGRPAVPAPGLSTPRATTGRSQRGRHAVQARIGAGPPSTATASISPARTLWRKARAAARASTPVPVPTSSTARGPDGASAPHRAAAGTPWWCRGGPSRRPAPPRPRCRWR
jgi:hypothetical protein